MENNGEQFKIGELSGKLEGLYNSFNDFKENNECDHKQIFVKLDNLNNWKLKTIGFVSGAWLILTIVWNLIDKYFKI